MNVEPLINIYKTNLKIKKDENVLIFTDTIREDEVIPENERTRRNALLEVAKKTSTGRKNFL